MTFAQFVQKLGTVIRAESSTGAFCKTVFEAILPIDKLGVLDEYKNPTFKSYYNGNSGISRIAKKINKDAQAENFADYINENYEDTTIQKLCDAFIEDCPDINCQNAGLVLGKELESIINEAAAQKKSPNKMKKVGPKKNPPLDVNKPSDGIINVSTVRRGEAFFDYILAKSLQKTDTFNTFITKAIDYYSTKKTLLYAEKPRPFYDLYVCNDLYFFRYDKENERERRVRNTISEATVEALEKESKYVLIQGTGGIGKSMFLTHLFLSSVKDYQKTGRLPVLVSLKDYRNPDNSIAEMVLSTVREYDPSLTQNDIIGMLEGKRLILLLDGLDEIQSALRDPFDKNLEVFVKAYGGNPIFITSRPMYDATSYSKFCTFHIEPLNKNQAMMLIKKLDYWDEKAKSDFLTALDQDLYYSHREFASNPLLLTIMLMTYSSFGEVPAKMHVFYSKAYETMARLHDATKGSYKRPLHTGLTPEEFKKLFAQFCARTYVDEVLDFTEISFDSYMEKVINRFFDDTDITARDFLLDLTENLCIMYYEGREYHFIHRSFQEYFAAVHFATGYDEKLKRVGDFFENRKNRIYGDRTFDMLYDMIPEKVERYIFLPFLDQLLRCYKKGGFFTAYWEFLEDQYPIFYSESGEVPDPVFNEPQSFIYKFLVNVKKLDLYSDLDYMSWPIDMSQLPKRYWGYAHKNFLEAAAFEAFSDPSEIDDELLDEHEIVDLDELSIDYKLYFGMPEPVGSTTEIDVYELQKYPSEYTDIRAFIESEEFPLVEEYKNILRYYMELKTKTEREQESKSLFED